MNFLISFATLFLLIASQSSWSMEESSSSTDQVEKDIESYLSDLMRNHKPAIMSLDEEKELERPKKLTVIGAKDG